MRIYFVFIISLFIVSCGNKEEEQLKMQLKVLSNYGTEEQIISDSTTMGEIKFTMWDIDWNNFHQVILFIDDTHWLEVSGNLQEDGFSAKYQENTKQFVIKTPLNTVDEMIDILIAYLKEYKLFKNIKELN